MTQPSLLDLLTLEQLDSDWFRANTVQPDLTHLYGGQVAAQAVVSAGRTVPTGWLPHSLHCYFLRAGNPQQPILYEVMRDRDGRSYAARRVVARQDGEIIFNLVTSFSTPTSTGPQWLAEPDPADVEPTPDLRVVLSNLLSIDVRADVPADFTGGSGRPTQLWARATMPLPDDELTHLAALTYLSDSYNGYSRLPIPWQGLGSSLDHSMWFRAPVRLDRWVFVEMAPNSVGAGRGVYHGSLWQDGQLVANIMQENVYRDPR